MRIRTKINVTYTPGISVTTTATGIIEGVINSVSWIDNPETKVFDQLAINYTYSIEGGSSIYKDGFIVSGAASLEGLYQAIKPSIPSDLDNATTEQVKFYLAFIQQMSVTFGISPTDIEIF